MKPSENLLKVIRFRRFSTVGLLIALVVFFICAPFVEELKVGDLVVIGLFSLVLLAGVLAVADQKCTLLVAIVLVIPAIAGRWIKSFPAGSSFSCFLSNRIIDPDRFRGGKFTSLRFARPVGQR